jgi:spore maturation protein CgeB
MKFLTLTEDYPDFRRWLYGQQPDLSRASYAQQVHARIETLFAGPYVYSSGLRKLGHEAEDIYWNTGPMQTAWARENGLKVPVQGEWEFRLRRGIVPWMSRVRTPQRGLYQIVAEQIKRYKPDILVNHAMDTISSRFIKEMKAHVPFLMGQHAAPLAANVDIGCYNLVISSLPDLVDSFRQRGVPAELSRLGYDPRWQSCADGDGRIFDVTFIGNLFRVHRGRMALLEMLCARLPQLRIWAPSIDHLPAGSPLRRVYQGPAWGREMYRVLSRSKIAVNIHGDFAPFANNGRLYEATGMGALLATDWKQNLPELFEPGKEVVAYRNPEQCCDLIAHYLKHDAERETIATAGQRRTQTDHTFARRIDELVDIVRKYI